MNWILKYRLFICIFILLFCGVFMVSFQGAVHITSSTWTVLLVTYFFFLSLLIGNEQHKMSAEETESGIDNVKQEN